MILIRLFLLSWAVALIAGVAYVFPPLALAGVYYVVAASYLALILAAPFVLVALALFLWVRRRRLI
jgi:hypothetical protein